MRKPIKKKKKSIKLGQKNLLHCPTELSFLPGYCVYIKIEMWGGNFEVESSKTDK